jgi:hypothetical protein
MKSNLQRRVLVTGLALVMAVLASFAMQQYLQQPAPDEETPTVGADWQQRGLLSEQEYVRVRGLGQVVVRTGTLSDHNLDWLLDTMQRSSSSIVHARVLGVLLALRNPPAAQKARIKTAITPLLQSRDPLDRRYAYRLQNKLALYR